VTRAQLEEIAKLKEPDLNAAISTPPCARSPAAPGAWALTWRVCRWQSPQQSAGKGAFSRSASSAKAYRADEALQLVKELARRSS
jgi:hypothetical protein